MIFSHIPWRPKFLQKNSLQRKCFGAINFVIITKESLYKANSLACFLAEGDPPVTATLQRKCSGRIIFVIITKIITKEIVPRNYFVIILARMVIFSGWTWSWYPNFSSLQANFKHNFKLCGKPKYHPILGITPFL